MKGTARSITDAIRTNAERYPDKEAVLYLGDGENVTQRMTFANVDLTARAIGAYLQEAGHAGKTAALIHPQDLEYVRAFLGCQYAGVIAVPLYPPNPARIERTLPRLRRVLADCNAKVILTTTEIKGLATALMGLAPELGEREWIATDEIDVSYASRWKRPDSLNEDSISFLQYTSGSTGTPRGVIVTHRNLLVNCAAICESFCEVPYGGDWGLLTWLPLYHDMGLIGNLLHPLVNAGQSIVMTPLHFLEKPSRWMRVVSRHNGTITGAPNFAFDLAVRKTTPQELEELDLSRVHMIYSGAEPLRKRTIDEFFRTFAPCGLKFSALATCYGLAEATLLVSGKRRYSTMHVDADAINSGWAVPLPEAKVGTSLVGSGPVTDFVEVKIVDVSTGKDVGRPNVVGEIFVRGPSIAAGYWGNEAATAETFGAKITDDPSGQSYLRTGDLGFIASHDNQLYISGRIKDLIIVRGRNYYPQDIERTTEEAHPAFRRGCCVAFSTEVDGESAVVVVQEFERRFAEPGAAAGDERRIPRPEVDAFGPTEKPDPALLRYDEAFNAVRRAVGVEHELHPHVIVFVKAGQIPKTSSGKVQRRETKRMFEDGELQELRRYTAPQRRSTMPPPMAAKTSGPSREEALSFIVSWISKNLGVANADPSTPLAELGLDSTGAVRLTNQLTAFSGRPVRPNVIFEYPSPSALADYVSASTVSSGGDEIEKYLEQIEQMSDDEVVSEMDQDEDPT